jgi:hypothetical protein
MSYAYVDRNLSVSRGNTVPLEPAIVIFVKPEIRPFLFDFFPVLFPSFHLAGYKLPSFGVPEAEGKDLTGDVLVSRIVVYVLMD